MHLMYFTEQPMSVYPEEEALKLGGVSALLLSNKYFDPVAGSRLYHERLEEYLYAEAMGVDGIMGFDHGVGHSLLLLYDAKAPIGKNSNYFNDLEHDLSNPSISLFCIIIKYLIFITI